MRAALVAEERAHVKNSLKVATALSRLGMLVALEYDFEAAQKLYERALRIREHVLGRDHLGVARSLENLARLHFAIGTVPRPVNINHNSIAFELLERALQIQERRLGPFHPNIAAASSDIADQMMLAARKYEKRALALYRKATVVREKTYGETSLPVAHSLLMSARFIDRVVGGKPGPIDQKDTEWCHRTDAAFRARRRALAIKEQRLGSDSPMLSDILRELAQTSCTEIGRDDDRLALRKRIVAIDEKAFGTESLIVAQDLEDQLALISSSAPGTEEKTMALRANAIREINLSRDPCGNGREVSKKWRKLTAQFDGQARLSGWEPIDGELLNLISDHHVIIISCRSHATATRSGNIDRVIKTYEKYGDKASAERVLRGYGSASQLADFLSAQGRLSEAAPYYKESLAKLYNDVLQGSSPNQPNSARRRAYYSSMDGYVAILGKQHDLKEAESLLQGALALEEGATDPDTANRIGRMDALADLFALEGRQVDALTNYQKALAVAEKTGSYGTDSGSAGVQKAAVLAQIDKFIGFDVATARFEEADALYRRSLTIEQPDYATIRLKGREPYATLYVAGPRKPAIIKRLERYAAFRRTQGDPQGADILHKRALAIRAIELEQDVINIASPLTREGADDWYDIKRWDILVPIYHELGDQTAEQRTAKLLAAANTRQDRANNIPPRGSERRPTTLPD